MRIRILSHVIWHIRVWILSHVNSHLRVQNNNLFNGKKHVHTLSSWENQFCLLKISVPKYTVTIWLFVHTLLHTRIFSDHNDKAVQRRTARLLFQRWHTRSSKYFWFWQKSVLPIHLASCSRHVLLLFWDLHLELSYR